MYEHITLFTRFPMDIIITPNSYLTRISHRRGENEFLAYLKIMLMKRQLQYAEEDTCGSGSDDDDDDFMVMRIWWLTYLSSELITRSFPLMHSFSSDNLPSYHIIIVTVFRGASKEKRTWDRRLKGWRAKSQSWQRFYGYSCVFLFSAANNI